MSEATSATDVAALDVGHADDGDAQEHGARGASPAAASSGASSGASPRAGLGVRRRDNSEASTSPMRSTASGSHGSRSPSQGPPSDALTTAHLVLQQWSALTEKPAVGIRDEVNGGEDVEDDDEDDDDDEEDEEGDIGGGGGRRYANGDAPRPASGPSSGTGNPSNKTFLICTVLSIQYMKLLVLMGLALPVSGVLVSDTFPQSFEAFYMYLYLVSLLFMMYVYIASAWRHRRKVKVRRRRRGTRGIRYRLRLLRRSRAVETVRYGSVYLRLAMNAFGIGNMIYCCLEVAHGVVKYQHYHCDQAEQQVRILLPACRAVLTLAQMHFMLFNNKASEIRRHRCVSRFGLAHMIATNICEWLSVVVEETRHEIAELGAGGHVLADHDELGGLAGRNYSSFDLNSTRPTTRPDCESAGGDSGGSPEQDVLGNLLQGSGPFLFPCTIEYSLICAVILFEMWIHVSHAKSDDEGSASRMGSRLDLSTDSRSSRVADPTGPPSASAVDQVTVEPVQDELQQDSDDGTNYKTQQSTVSGAGSVPWRTPLHLSVDLTHSQRGMFLGIVLLVATIMSLVLFFALGEADGYQRAAHALVSYVEGSLHVAVILGVGLAAFGMRRLGSDNAPLHPLPLDMFLLFVAQAGAYVYSIFSIVGACVLLLGQADEAARSTAALRVLVVEVLSVVHAGVQTHFLLRAWHMRCVGERQWSSKPGREHITFLIHANLCCWLVATFCKSRAQFRPVHLNLFGVWPWTVLTHASIPLTIFLHFHSSICLFEVWKNTYKFRPD